MINGTDGVVLNRGGENLGLMHHSQKLANGLTLYMGCARETEEVGSRRGLTGGEG